MKCVYEGFMTVEKITAVPTENNLILLLFYVTELCASPVRFKEAVSLLTDGPCYPVS